MTTLSILMTLALFGTLGYLLSRSLHFRWPLVLALAVGAIAAGWIGVNASIISVFGFGVRLNWAIQSCLLGVLAGLLIRRHPGLAR